MVLLIGQGPLASSTKRGIQIESWDLDRTPFVRYEVTSLIGQPQAAVQGRVHVPKQDDLLGNVLGAKP